MKSEFKEYSQYTLKELKSELQGLNEAIDILDCFGTHDLLMRDAIENEITKRGYDIVPSYTRFKLVKTR
jgi:hypothetical protein